MITFDDIFGQERAIERLKSAWRSERLPHGLIFAGPAGVGKATTALALGALFLCEKPNNDQACGKCESCALMGSGGHPDYRVIYKELIRYHDKTGKSKGTSISVEVIRAELIERAGRKAVMGRGKVFVVEEADLLLPPAQNALLKTLEEPPGRTLVMLLTDHPHYLLPTIRSRAQMVAFASLNPKRVARELEKRGIGKGPAAEAAGLAEGSLGLALRWLKEGVVEAARELINRVDAQAEGRAAGDLAAFLKASADAYAEKQLERDELASKDQATKEGLALYLKLAANRLREKLAGAGEPEQLEQICASIDAIVRAENYLDSNVNVALTLQQLAVTLERELTSA